MVEAAGFAGGTARNLSEWDRRPSPLRPPCHEDLTRLLRSERFLWPGAAERCKQAAYGYQTSALSASSLCHQIRESGSLGIDHPAKLALAAILGHEQCRRTHHSTANQEVRRTFYEWQLPNPGAVTARTLGIPIDSWRDVKQIMAKVMFQDDVQRILLSWGQVHRAYLAASRKANEKAVG
ncbi:hypothetical protein C0Q70_04684 [Pomacea canaliculata]|uniref:Uncharacterized protein n=1 Tax=Pomacea canaliculata TaxID=400727 RepID=A0A2T7PJ28_POMCA|nr:hypothetical protein C0Q70_04684 [Pomacea canaliculata]